MPILSEVVFSRGCASVDISNLKTGPEEIDSKPPTGWTALHQAAVLQTANVDVIEKLVSLGCFRNLRTLDTRETAYDLAKKANRDRNILSALKPVYYKQLDATTISNLQKGLNSVVHSRVNDLVCMIIPSPDMFGHTDRNETNSRSRNIGLEYLLLKYCLN